MGTQYLYSCTACGYEASVSGGGDAGMIVCTQTIVCTDCKELYDIVTEHHGFRGGKQAGPYPEECPLRKSHKVEHWEKGAPCPKCGGPMVQGPMTRLWD